MSYKQEPFSEQRAIAVREAEKQYNNWRTWGQQLWAKQWLNYHDALCDRETTNRNWKQIPVPMNHEEDKFLDRDKNGALKPYKRASRLQNVRH